MNTRHAMPSIAELQASPCAAFPADQVTTPRFFSSSVSEASFASIPRGLNDPVRWKSSAFRWTRAPVRSDSVREPNIGVRSTLPAIVSRARRMSPRLSSGMHGGGGRHPQPHREDCQAAGHAAHLNRPAHRLGELLHECEPQRRADRPLAPVARVEVEALERTLAVAGLEPRAGVFDLE